MSDLEFRQNLALTLAANPEFVKQAKESHEGKQIWWCVKEQLNACVNSVVANMIQNARKQEQK